MDPDDAAYHRNARTMAAILVAFAVIIFVSLVVFPHFTPTGNTFLTSVTESSPYGVELHLTVNSTALKPTGTLNITGWATSTSGAIQNVTAADFWPLAQGDLQGSYCSSGFPIGLGVMRGLYTAANYSSGTLVGLTPPPCRSADISSDYYLFYPHSSIALVAVGGSPVEWDVVARLSFGHGAAGVSQLSPGVYTAVLADEWGDVLTTNFTVT